MRPFYISLSVVLLLFFSQLAAQDSVTVMNRLRSYVNNNLLLRLDSAELIKYNLKGDSSIYANPLSILTASPLKWYRPSQVTRLKKSYTVHGKLIEIGHGYINYNWLYRSAVDTPFNATNISQHYITGVLNVWIAGQVPMTQSAI